jgi:DNA-binding NarL/FixJ family response regulator
VVILSGSANPSIAQRALECGAAGFITKSGRSDELLHALRQILAGEVYAPAEFLPTRHTPQPATDVKPPVFTPRQQEVLQLLLDGYSNRDIGEQLSLSDETVKNHVTNILRGFGVKTRTQAALEAGRWGYGGSPPINR